jgi:hypothetical protein
MAQADPNPPAVASASPVDAYRQALERYDGAALAAIAEAIGVVDLPPGRPRQAARLLDELGAPRTLDRALASAPLGARLALTLASIVETHAWRLEGLKHALATLGVSDASEAIGSLAATGLAALEFAEEMVRRPAVEIDRLIAATTVVHVHPAALTAVRTVLPDGPAPPACGPVAKVRESDGLEFLIRLAGLWQRAADSPLRQTQQGGLYKRDRDRIEDDPVLAGPIADVIEPIPDMPAFWLAIAQGVGLLESEPGSDRLSAADPDFWAENAFHLPRAVAARWLGLHDWHEIGGMQRDGAVHALALPFVRPAVLLWLATLDPNAWVALDDLAAHVRMVSPHWAAATFLETGAAPVAPVPDSKPLKARKSRPRGASQDRAEPPRDDPDVAALEAMLCGAAYQLGVVRVAREADTGRVAVQLAPLGRYLLAVGPPPSWRSAFDQFLFVQPNLEVIAYRQGLTPPLIGRLSRFLQWTQVGAALAMKLTPESVYRGLEGGLSPSAMLDLLERHNPRGLPSAVTEAVRSWAGRRDRVAFHASATLLEFASSEDLDAALRDWPGPEEDRPLRAADRLLLVEDESVIPWSRFRMTGSRNYRLPAEPCVDVDADGVTLTLDPARSDLLVDAEIARLADPIPGGGARSRFVVTAESLARAAATGMTGAEIAAWFARRAGEETPPSVGLLLAVRAVRRPAFSASRPLILHAPSESLLDGLFQHPATRDLLGDRLGPTAAVVPDRNVDAFRRALERLGASLTLEASSDGSI